MLQKMRTFAAHFENALLVKAAAQHSSSKLDSAFALHFPCTLYKHKLKN